MPKGIYDHSVNKGTTGLHWKIKDTSKMCGRHPIYEFSKNDKRLIGNKYRKGLSAWNKGTTGLMVCWNKGKLVPKVTGEKNPLWKGDNVSYRSLHKWVERWLGKAYECVYCGKEKFKQRIEWASVSHHAKRDLSDYISLCVTCHREYDRKARI